jgi:predicted 2-oxoglutarate/Fe(II)-dependent dioxygenase YbiX
MSIVGISIWDDIQNRLNKTISAYAGRRLLVHSTPYARIYKSGSSKSLHADGEGATDSGQPIVMDGYKQDYESCSMLVEYASNIYLNNDFSGGDLYFPYLDVTIKPQKNQLIFFPSGIEFSHQVNEITDGERFAVSTFYTTEKLVSLHALT